MSTRINLRAVCSAQVRSQANNNVPESGTVAWSVDETKPFGDPSNLGRFAQQLNLTVPLELCHYYEGTFGDVIDLSRTPAELAYRPRMSVYVRIKKVQRKESSLLPDSVAMTLSADEERLLRRLAMNVRPNLAPQDPCPVCARTDMTDEERIGAELGYGGGASPTAGAGSLALSASRSMMMSPGGAGAGGAAAGSSDVSFGTRGKADMGVQCGNAGRIGDGVMNVTFGTASRLRETRLDRPVSYSGGGSFFSGAGAFEFDDAATDLKRQLEEAVRERDVLKRQFEDMRSQKEGLERWKSEHRCEVSKEVSKLRDENVMLHHALRDLMRGREEVFARLHERRTAGSMLTDTPRQYEPFAVSVPYLDGSTQLRPAQLLANTSGSGSASPGRYNCQSMRSGSGRGGADDGDGSAPGDEQSPPRALLKRPSGVAAANVGVVSPNSRSDAAAVKVESHVPGQCLLRIASVAGDPFYVKRNMASRIGDGGQHVFTLLSLDGIVTDEIHVSELELCATEGPSGLTLATARHSWTLFMAPSERTQWLHWLYALNPFLSAQKRDHAGVPNSI